MPLPTATELLTLDLANRGEPFVRISTGPELSSLDLAFRGEPFFAITGAQAMGSSLTLPSITGSGTGSGPITRISIVTIRPPTASGIGQTGPVGRSDLSISAVTGEGGGSGALSIPSIIGEASGLVGSVGGSAGGTPKLIAIGTGNPGALGRSSLKLPSIEGVGYGAPISRQTLPAIVAHSSGLVGQIARSNQALQALQGEASGTTQIVGESFATIPTVKASGSGLTAVVGASNVTLKKLIVAANGLSGTVGSSEVVVPIVRTASSGHLSVVGVSILTLPAILAESAAARPVGAAYQGYALQTQTKALTTYSGLRVNSFAHFNGVALAAGPDGLFILEGATDAGALINARVRVGITDFETPELKRIEAMYVNYRTDGDLSLKVIADDTTEYDYPITAHGSESLNTTRTVIGKGLKGVYWQFEVSNENGADFELDALDPRVIKQSRRIG